MRLDDGRAVMRCEECKEGRNGVAGEGCTAMYCRNMCKDRLAAYEDTGLTPAEVSALVKDWSDLCTIVGECGGIDRIRKLADAGRDGRMVVLCWIPVTERLPEDSVKECIIFVPRIPENIVGLGRYLGSGRWVIDGWYLTPEAVAYWMPLPEAPLSAEKQLCLSCATRVCNFVENSAKMDGGDNDA